MTSKGKLTRLKPIKFPRNSGTGRVAYKITGTKGRSTKEVVAEIKRLSKKGIFPSD